MSQSDAVIYDESLAPDLGQYPFVKRDGQVYVTDQNNGNYSGNQITIDTSYFANDRQKWASYSEAVLEIPFTWAVKSSTDISGTFSSYNATIKSGFWQLIDSFQVDYNGTTVVQQMPYINSYISFKAVTSWSQDDQLKFGEFCGFWKDTASSYLKSGAASLDGSGYTNNRLTAAALFTLAVAGSVGMPSNEGVLRRALATGYSATAGSFFTSNASPVTTGRSYQSTIANGGAAGTIYFWNVLATIRLKDVSDFFAQVPLTKGAYFRFLITVNSGSFITPITAGPAAIAITAAPTINGHTNPIIVASAAASNPMNPIVAGGAAVLSWACGVGNSVAIAGVSVPNNLLSVCRLYVPLYAMNPEYEQRYLELYPTKEINYTDVYATQQIAVPTGNFTYNLTNGLKGVKALLVVPQTNIASNVAGVCSEALSPFSTAPATLSPECAISNYQVYVGGIPIYANPIQYDYEEFMNEIYKTGLNGGNTTGLSSGLLSFTEWQHLYRYYLTDLTRSLPIDFDLAKSINLQGSITSVNTVDLYYFVVLGKQVTLDMRTGAIVSSKLG